VLATVQPTQAARIRRSTAFQTDVFQVATNARIVVGTNRSAALGDLKVGDRVSLSYDRENGTLVAHHIADGVPPKPRNPSVHPAPKTQHPHRTSSLAHVHGVLQSVDVQASITLLSVY
jgi:hypothetical protein